MNYLKRLMIREVVQQEAMHELVGTANTLEQMAGTCIFKKHQGAERKEAYSPKPKAKNIMLEERTQSARQPHFPKHDHSQAYCTRSRK